MNVTFPENLDVELPGPLVESEQWGDIVSRRDWLSDTPDFGFGNHSPRISSPYDRARGKCSPFFEHERDLANIRGIARFIHGTNESAICALENLTSHVLDTGFVYSASPKDKRIRKDAVSVAVQEALDEILQSMRWTGDKETEAFTRAVRDGEAFIWVRDNGGRPSIRLVEPDYVTEPKQPASLEDALGLSPLDWSFGVASQWNNAERIAGYHIEWMGDNNDWQFVPAEEMVHIKLNVDGGIKRGISDFYAVYLNLERSEKLLENTLQGAAIQAAIAFIREHAPGTPPSTITDYAKKSADQKTAYNRPGGGQRTVLQRKITTGTIIDAGHGNKYHAGPLGQSSAPTYIDVMQAALRIIGSRWQMPEYMISADASNANYSSTIAAGSPFDRATKRRQAFCVRHFTEVIWKALGILCRSGEFSSHGIGSLHELKQAVAVKVDPPIVGERDRNQEELIREIRYRNGILSAKTWAGEAGLDYDQELQFGAKPQSTAAGVVGVAVQGGEIRNDAGNSPAEQTNVESRLNGAQVTAAVEVLNGVAAGTTAEITAVELLVAIGIDGVTARKMVSASRGLVPKSPGPTAAVSRETVREALTEIISETWKGYPGRASA